MNYFNLDFPEKLTYCFEKEVEFLTTISSTKNKKEVCNHNWTTPRYKFNLVHKTLNKNDFQQLQSLFLVCKGQGTAFNFLDKTDYEIINQQIGLGDGVNKNFDIYKIYSYQNYSYKRRIYNLNNVCVYLNGDKIEETAYTISNGTLSFKEGNIPLSGQVITMDAEFNVIVRFNTDLLKVTSKGQYVEIDDLSLIETRIV